MFATPGARRALLDIPGKPDLVFVIIMEQKGSGDFPLDRTIEGEGKQLEEVSEAWAK